MIGPLVLFAASLAPNPTATPIRANSKVVYAHHAVTCDGPAAQTIFDRGLTLFFAYNGSQGVHVFQQAIDADSRFAMGYWGLALSYGRDINSDLTEDHFKKAQAAIEKAAVLERGLSDAERAYIDAMHLRYAGSWRDRDQDERAYRNAMSAAVTRFPMDDDLTALYAEALLEHAGRTLWKPGTNFPATSDTTAMVEALDRVIERNPRHIMANHLLVHIFEPSTDRKRAIAAAQRLDMMPFAPEDEHLAHMPAHTWVDVGDYARAVASSKRAIGLFDQYLAAPDTDRGHKGYLAHDINVGWSASLMLGDYAAAQLFATRLQDNDGESDYGTLTALRFGDWRRIELLKPKDSKDPLHVFMAYENLVRGDVNAARAQLAPLFETKENSSFFWAVRGRLALAERDRKAADTDFRKARDIEKDQYGGENLPTFPTQEVMGFSFYRAGDLASAENSFHEALKAYPNDPRALYGLSQTLRKEGEPAEAQRLMSNFKTIWQRSDVNLSMETL